MKTQNLIVINKEANSELFTLDENTKILIEKSSLCTILCTYDIGQLIMRLFTEKNITFVYYDLSPYFDAAKYNLHLLLDELRKEFKYYQTSIVNPKFDSRSCLEFLRIYQKKLNKTNLLDLVSTICQLKASIDISEDNQVLFLNYNNLDVCILRQILVQIVSQNIRVSAPQLLPIKNTSLPTTLKRFTQTLALLLNLYRNSKPSAITKNFSTKKNLAIVVDDIWHLYSSENLLQSTYFLDISRSLECHFDIHWLVLINPILSKTIPLNLRQALEKELDKQKVSLLNIIEFIFRTLRIWLQLYIIKYSCYLMNKFNSSNIHGIMAYEIDDLIGRVHVLLSNNTRRHAFDNNINDVIYVDRKPFSNAAKSIKNLYDKSNSIYVGIQHGITNINQLGYTFSRNEINQMSSRDLLPDYMLVFGQNTFHYMSTNHFPEERLSISGSFVYTNLKPSLTCSLNNRYKYILIALQYPNEDLHGLVNVIAKSLIGNDEYIIVIRPHPTYPWSGSVAAKVLIDSGIASNKVLVSSNKLHDDLNTSDMLITQSSSIVFDYLNLSKPIVIYNGHSRYNDNFLFNEYQCFDYFVSSEELTGILVKKHINIKYALRYLFAERHVSTSTKPSVFLKTLVNKDF